MADEDKKESTDETAEESKATGESESASAATEADAATDSEREPAAASEEASAKADDGASASDEDEDEDEDDEDEDEDEDEDDEAEAAAKKREERAATVAAAREVDRAAEGSPYRALPAHHGHEDHGLAHVTPVKLLVGVLAALLVLTVITVAVTKIDLGGQGNLIVAMVIATIKAALVVTYFMHLRWDKSFNVLVFLSSVLFLILFLSLSLTDRNEYQPAIDLLEQTQTP